MINEERLRRVEVLMRDGSWQTVNMGQLEKNDIFRMFEPDGTVFSDEQGAEMFVVQISNSVTAVGLKMTHEELIEKLQSSDDVEIEVISETDDTIDDE